MAHDLSETAPVALMPRSVRRDQTFGLLNGLGCTDPALSELAAVEPQTGQAAADAKAKNHILIPADEDALGLVMNPKAGKRSAPRFAYPSFARIPKALPRWGRSRMS